MNLNDIIELKKMFVFLRKGFVVVKFISPKIMGNSKGPPTRNKVLLKRY